MAGFTSRLPNIAPSAKDNEETRRLKNYVVQLAQQLDYALYNIGEDNFTEELLNRLKSFVTKVDELETESYKQTQEISKITATPYVSKAIQSVESTELSEIVSVPLNLDFTVDDVQSDTVISAAQAIDVTTAGTLSTTYEVDSDELDFAPEQALTVGNHIIPHIVPMSLLTGNHNIKIKQTFDGAGTTALGDLQGVISGQISGVNIEIPPNYNCIFKFAVTGGSEFTLPIVSENTELGTIYWGDGTSEAYRSSVAISHTYAESGDYNIVLTAPITCIRGIFRRTDLKSIVLSDNVIELKDQAFISCTNLTSVNFGKSLKTIGSNSFSGTGLSGTLTLPETLIKLSGAFSSCKSLSKVVMKCPNLVSTNGYIFTSSTALSEIHMEIPIAIPDSFANSCINLRKVVIGGGCTAIGFEAFAEDIALSDVTIPDSVTSIGYNAFIRTGLSSITIPPSVKSIGDNAFMGTGLTSVTIARDCIIGAGALPANCTINYYN